MYTDNTNGSCPPLVIWTTPVCTTWMQIMMPYIKNYKVFGCPSSDFVPSTASDIEGGLGGCLTYGWNANIFNYQTTFKVTLSDVTRPSKTIFMCDSVYANWISLPGSSSASWGRALTINNKTGYWTRPIGNPLDKVNRHKGRVNATFCDGHVASMPYNELVKTESGTGKKVVMWKYQREPMWSYIEDTLFTYFQTSASGGHL